MIRCGVPAERFVRFHWHQTFRSKVISHLALFFSPGAVPDGTINFINVSDTHGLRENKKQTVKLKHPNSQCLKTYLGIVNMLLSIDHPDTMKQLSKKAISIIFTGLI